MKIEISKKAVKGLAKLPKTHQKKFYAAFRKIASDDTDSLDIKKLKGVDGYRLRIGNYRALYEIVDGVLVMRVGPRGDVYK